MSHRSPVGRRNFIRGSGLMIAGGAIGGAMAVGKAVYAGTRSEVRIAMIGCGRRARTLADAVLGQGDHSIKLVGLADQFPSQTQSMYRALKGRYGDQIDAACVRAGGERAFEEVLSTDADLVYLTAPPVFRRAHFEAAVAAGKHCFLEKPIAASAADLMQMRSVAESAMQQGLSVHAGFQRALDPGFAELVAKIDEGIIGRPMYARTYCNAGPLPSPKRRGGDSSETYQLRNWNHFRWTGGDFLVEQHASGLDLVRRAIGAHPTAAQGQGGFESVERVLEAAACDPASAPEVFDHHSIEFEFAGGVRLMSQCRRVAGSWNQTSEHLHGTEGVAELSTGIVRDLGGKRIWTAEIAKPADATLMQQSFVIDAVRQRLLVSDFEEAASSTLMALLGQRASISGKRESWDRMIRSARG